MKKVISFSSLGHPTGEAVLPIIITFTIYHSGFNAATGQIESLMETGIIDPTKTVRIALVSAVSATITLLNSECIVVEALDNDDEVEVV